MVIERREHKVEIDNSTEQKYVRSECCPTRVPLPSTEEPLKKQDQETERTKRKWKRQRNKEIKVEYLRKRPTYLGITNRDRDSKSPPSLASQAAGCQQAVKETHGNIVLSGTNNSDQNGWIDRLLWVGMRQWNRGRG